MKHMMVILLVLATGVCMTSFGRTPGSESRVSVIKQGPFFKLIYDGSDLSIVSVVIADDEGNEIFKEQIFGQKFVRPYNLSLLPQGDYEIVVNDGADVKVEKICSREPALIAHVAKLKSDPSKYLLSIPHQQTSDITIHIYDSNSQEVHQERHQLAGDFGKIFQLKDLPDATIEIVNQNSGEAKVFKIR